MEGRKSREISELSQRLHKRGEQLLLWCPHSIFYWLDFYRPFPKFNSCKNGNLGHTFFVEERQQNSNCEKSLKMHSWKCTIFNYSFSLMTFSLLLSFFSILLGTLHFLVKYSAVIVFPII